MTTTLKTCFKCDAPKPLHEFYRHSQMGDGHLNKCKECTKLDVQRNRRARIDYYRKYDRERGNRQGYGYVKKYRSQNPDKAYAHNAVSYALRVGKLERPKVCVNCRQPWEGLHAHHHDYSRPLDVEWLCPPCHAAEHH